MVPLVAAAAAGCDGGNFKRVVGQTDFVSAPPAGNAAGHSSTFTNGATAGGAAVPQTASTATTTPTRTVEETDLYRLDGNRLYYLNSYRGLMVFDVTDVDHPTLLGRSAIYGSPVDMIVRNGVAIVVVADWYGQMDDGSPFHGSIVRGLDATDPTNIKVLGEAKLGGWVRDDRVVGDVIYAVSEDYGWVYGWDAPASGGGAVAVSNGVSSSTETVIVSSVSFANNVIQSVGKVSFPGYTGVFNVTPNSILLAHDTAPAASGASSNQTELLYLDISDPGGNIVQRGSLVVNGQVQGWGADNGRWNLDFADGKTAHVVGCAAGAYGYCDGTSGYVLSIGDFTNPDAPTLSGVLTIPSTGWSVAARFDTNRLYLSPQSGYWDPTGTMPTPFQVYDLTNSTAPVLAGTVNILGTVWNILPAPNLRLFALGESYTNTSDSVSLQYLDVTTPSSPQLIGTSTFGEGWAWTPAAGTFKAFTMDATKGMVVLPFSGWSSTKQAYNNGLQLIDFTASTITTGGASKTRGWVERGIFVKNRLVSLSDLALSVVDYTDHNAPVVTNELVLARNVVTAQPQGNNIAEISSDWWDNDVSYSEVRLLPIANAEESSDVGNAPTVQVDGVGARVFTNGNLAYVVTSVRVPAVCDSYGRPTGAADPSADPKTTCYGRAQQVQVVDLSNGITLRGKIQLPMDTWGWYGWGWYGFWWYDWFGGEEAVQVGGDALAFRRWEPIYDPNGYYIDSNSSLWVVDLRNPDAPTMASLVINDDPNAWWGNMQVVGSTLYTGHYEWFEHDTSQSSSTWTVRYYADRIDLSDRANPRVGAKINIPGLLVGGSATDPSLLYTIDYRWDQDIARDDFDVVRVDGLGRAQLVSSITLDGYVGSTFVRGNIAYLSAQLYNPSSNGYSLVELHAIDLTDPTAPVDRVSTAASGWGWLLDVQGDRAVVSSGWGQNGVDIYQLTDGQAPQFRQFARTLGWWANGVSRQGNTLFISSGYWGVEKIALQ
jgi:hypothetical protein